MGHCRGAVVGDALAACSNMRATGDPRILCQRCRRPGRRARPLGHLRYREALGRQIGEIPEGLYPGDYLKPVGAALAAEYGEPMPTRRKAPGWRSSAAGRSRRCSTSSRPISPPRASTTTLRLRARGAGIGRGRRALELLRREGAGLRGTLPPPKGKQSEDWEPTELLLFRSTEFGDDQDRPIKKSDGSWTYFAADTAYHMQKLAGRRRADQRLGRRPYRHGEAHPGGGRGARRPAGARRQARPDGAAAAERRAGEDVEALGQASSPSPKWSRRSARTSSASPCSPARTTPRWISISPRWSRRRRTIRSSTSNMPMPGSARCAGGRRRPAWTLPPSRRPVAARRGGAGAGPARRAIPAHVEAAAAAHEPHRIAFYLGDLAAAFHALWNRGNDDPTRSGRLCGTALPLLRIIAELTRARLELAGAIGQIIRNGLGIMGVAAAEEMQ
jgi:arginyl-tRNA synthetase